MLETFFTNEDIKDIYDELVIYSIKKYEIEQEKIEKLNQETKSTIKKQYKRALLALKKRKIKSETLNNKTIEQLEKSLITYQQNYYMILSLNENTIDDIALQMKERLLTSLLSVENELERISLLFDFMSEYFSYSYVCHQYCNQIPFASEYAFDFKNNIPIDSTYNSTLVMGQGLCGDLANFLKVTGQAIGLNIETICVNHNNSYHSLNKITFSNGQSSLIDITSHIKDRVPKSSCFLVSESKLNEQNVYHFFEELPQTITIPSNNLNTQELAINLANELKKYYPEINDLNKKRTYKYSSNAKRTS